MTRKRGGWTGSFLAVCLRSGGVMEQVCETVEGIAHPSKEEEAYKELERRLLNLLKAFPGQQTKDKKQDLMNSLLDLLEDLQEFQDPSIFGTLRVADAIRLDMIITEMIEKLSQPESFKG